MSNESKITPLNEPGKIILPAHIEKQQAKDAQQQEKETKTYLTLLDKYVNMYVTALENGEDIFANLNLAWKMRCTMTNTRPSKIIANPLDFEKVVERHKAIANNVPSLGEALVSLERKLHSIEELLQMFSDKEHVLYRSIYSVLFPVRTEAPASVEERTTDKDNQSNNQ